VPAEAPRIPHVRWLLAQLYGEEEWSFQLGAFQQQDLIDCPTGRDAKYHHFSAHFPPNESIEESDDHDEGEGEAVDLVSSA
jgi:hypothetical protein